MFKYWIGFLVALFFLQEVPSPDFVDKVQDSREKWHFKRNVDIRESLHGYANASNILFLYITISSVSVKLAESNIPFLTTKQPFSTTLSKFVPSKKTTKKNEGRTLGRPRPLDEYVPSD